MTKWALILGGSSGLGLASAKKLASEGFHLYILFRDRKSAAEEAERHFEEIRAMGVQCIAHNRDALKEESISQSTAELAEILQGQKLSLMLHSIAKGNLKLMAPFVNPIPQSPYLDATSQRLQEEFADEKSFLKSDDFHLTVEAMATSYYNWSSALFQAELLGEGSLLLTLTSEGGRKAWRNYGAVSAAKAALEAINRNMAVEFAPYGIRANVIQAGVTDTPALNRIKGNEIMKQQSLLRNPYGRLTQPEDVGNVVYLLSREEAGWINGAIIPVDGGESIA